MAATFAVSCEGIESGFCCPVRNRDDADAGEPEELTHIAERPSNARVPLTADGEGCLENGNRRRYRLR